MKLLTVKKNNQLLLAVKVKEGIINLDEALKHVPNDDISCDMLDVISEGKTALKRIEDYINKLDLSDNTFVYEEPSIQFGPAIPNPQKIICVGLNYKKHADETNLPYPDTPILFNKFANALTGHLNEVVIPDTTKRLDYEVELGIIIGKEVKNIKEEEALDAVFGYCTANDLSARDLQKRTSQWMLGKTDDGFAPVGPYLVTKDEIENPNCLNLRTVLNDEERQNSNTKDMIFSCEEIISYISKHMTLMPGDLILTGTPEGVIIGKPIEERDYLKKGDRVTVEVGGLGALTTQFI